MISLQRGDIDVSPSHTELLLFFTFSNVLRVLATKNHPKGGHQKLFPPKSGAKKQCKTLNTWVNFEKKYAFRSSVVTSMCLPPTRNCYFFFTFSNVPRVLQGFSTLKALKIHSPKWSLAKAEKDKRIAPGGSFP